MDVKIFSEVYEMNKKLDDVFIQKYNHPEFIKKNKLELLVEIGEFANETRCFKYWSKKEVNHDLVGFELADCFIMTLCFFNSLQIDLQEDFSYELEKNDTVEQFFNLYHLALTFIQTDDREVLKELFIGLINIVHQLGFKTDEMVNYCKEKITKDLMRLTDEKTS